MCVFVTGGTGYIGRAVVGELTGAGYEVTVLLRSPEKEGLVSDLGARSHPGDMTSPETYRSEAAEHDALLHLAFQYGPETTEADRTAVRTLLESAREGRARLVVYTSGCWVLGETRDGPAAEDAPVDRPASVVEWRPAHERQVLEAAVGGPGSGYLATAVIRPGMVYGGEGALTGRLFETAVEDGAAEYVGDGENRWSLVHLDDLARLYRLVVEREAAGVFHGVDGTPMRVAEVAAAASRAAGAGGEARGVPVAQAREKLGPVADALCLDQVLEGRRARALGWRPERPSFREGAEAAYREWRQARG